MRNQLLTLLLSAMPLASWGGPAYPAPFAATLADGSEVTLMLVGDEHGHAYRDVATGTLYRYDDDTRTYIALHTPAVEALQRHAAARQTVADERRARRAPARAADAVTGKHRGLVILADFSDRRFTTDHTAARIARIYNEVGYSEEGHIGSVHDYFSDQSYGQLDLVFDVVGPVTVSRSMAYYGANDTYGNDLRAATFVAEACRLAAAEGTDFSPYDWDGDGEVDQVVVVYAGYGENFTSAEHPLGTCIWPQEFSLSLAAKNGDGTGPITLGGKRIDTFACVAELTGNTGTRLMTIGPSCHEFSHCLGFPDFYDTRGTQYGMNRFDLMDMGNYAGPTGQGEVPCGFTAYERWMAGWITPTELTKPLTVTAMQPMETDGTAYIIRNPAAPECEYLLLENRQQGRWFSYVGTADNVHGLFVTHVDYDAVAWETNMVNTARARQRMTPIPAAGAYARLAQDYATTLFPGLFAVTDLTPASHNKVGGAWYNGASSLAHSLTDITEHADGTISFLYDGGTVPVPTVGHLVRTIDAVYDGRATLHDVDRMVSRILERDE